MGIGNLSADLKVYIEQNLVNNEEKKDRLINLIYKIKSHFDSGHDVDINKSLKDWGYLSSEAKQLTLFVITDKNSFICLNNKHKQNLKLEKISPVKSYARNPNEFDKILQNVMKFTKIEEKNKKIDLDHNLGEEIVEKIQELTTNIENNEKSQNLVDAKPAAEETEPSEKLNDAGSEHSIANEPTKDSESTKPLAPEEVATMQDEENNIIITHANPQPPESLADEKTKAENVSFEPSEELNNDTGSEYPEAIQPPKDFESTKPLVDETADATIKKDVSLTRYSNSSEKSPSFSLLRVINFFRKSTKFTDSQESPTKQTKQTSWLGNLLAKFQQAYTNQKNLPLKPTIKTQIPAINRQSPNWKNPYHSPLPQHQKNENTNTDAKIFSHQIEQRPINPIQKSDPDTAPQNIEFSKPPEGYPDGTLANERLMFKILEKVREK